MKNIKNATIELDNNIGLWVKLETDMIPYGLLTSAIKGGQDEWTEITKSGEVNEVNIMARASAWRFREYFANRWVRSNAEALTKIGFHIYCSQWGNYLVLDADTDSDSRWEKVRAMRENN